MNASPIVPLNFLLYDENYQPLQNSKRHKDAGLCRLEFLFATACYRSSITFKSIQKALPIDKNKTRR